MKILALSTYPEKAAATRFRVAQYIHPLAKRGIEVDLRPFLSAAHFSSLYSAGGIAKNWAGTLGALGGRLRELTLASDYDLLLVQREAMPFGPAIFERLFQAVGKMPMVLDLDDATYVRYVSPTYGRLGSALKFFGKTDKLIDRSAVVICGNRYIAEYVEARGTETVVIPTLVDTEIFRPTEKATDLPVIGWIGTHSTYPFLRKLFPIFQSLAKHHSFRLKIVGAGVEPITLNGVEIDSAEWSLEREVSDFQSLDIGLYPLDTDGDLDAAWLAGKSGFKAIQYLAVGVPFVMSPVGVCSEIGEHRNTHFNAVTEQDWYNHLDKLLSDSDLRSSMGKAGRRYSVKNYDLEQNAGLLAETLERAIKSR